MSFEKKDWKCGDTITAEDLNRLEGGVKDALECCGSGDAGYSCTEGWVTLTDESVTTVLPEGYDYPEAQLAYSTPIDSETIKVTFNGTEYTCRKNEQGGYGALWNGASPDWSEYPFTIGYDTDFNANRIFTETVGTYKIKIEAVGETIETSECFKKAVKAVTGNTEPLIVDVDTTQNTWQVLQTSWQAIHDEYIEGRTILFQEVDSFQKQDAFGSVVGVSHGTSGSNYYIDVYVRGQLCRFSASAPNASVTYNRVS